MKKRVFSILLVLAMVASMLPLSAVTVGAAPAEGASAKAAAKNYEVDNWGELRQVLEWDSGSTPITITLTADIYEETGVVWDEEPVETVQIIGNKTLDLKGYKIEYNDKTN